MRVALTSGTTSTKAVFQSLLALSSLHRYGIQSQAFEYKMSSIGALATASKSKSCFSSTEVIQHVAAGMLLCSFEVHQSSCTSSQWTWYIAGVKEILNSSCLQDLHQDSDLDILRDWVYYHDVLSHFTLRHWRGGAIILPPEISPLVLPDRTYLLKRLRITHAASSNFAILELLSELCDTVSTKSHTALPAQQLEDYRSFLRILDWKVRHLPIPTTTNKTTNTNIELFQLAILVYLNRSTENLLDHISRTQHHISKAFTLFSKLDSCERQFPVFVLGCEARTDKQRTTILQLIDRTELKVSSRSLNHVKMMLQAVWAQDDLAVHELSYWDKISSVFSCCTIVPSLV
jgi:hypothetical protein